MPHNPWAGYTVTGTWEDHASYSAGGTDYPLGYGTSLVAPAAGTLETSGGSGEFAAGWVGSAGRRSVLYLDSPIARSLPASSSPPEAAGPMVAIVIQHQSNFGTPGHHAEGSEIGWSGASAGGSDYGGDIHLHVHGLDADGNRLDFTKCILGTEGPGGPTGPGTGAGNLAIGTDGRLTRVTAGSGTLRIGTDGRLTRGVGNLVLATDGRLTRIP